MSSLVSMSIYPFSQKSSETARKNLPRARCCHVHLNSGSISMKTMKLEGCWEASVVFQNYLYGIGNFNGKSVEYRTLEGDHRKKMKFVKFLVLSVAILLVLVCHEVRSEYPDYPRNSNNPRRHYKDRRRIRHPRIQAGGGTIGFVKPRYYWSCATKLFVKFCLKIR